MFCGPYSGVTALQEKQSGYLDRTAQRPATAATGDPGTGSGERGRGGARRVQHDMQPSAWYSHDMRLTR